MNSLFGIETFQHSWWRSGLRASFILIGMIILGTVAALFMSFAQIPPFEHQEGIPLELFYALAIEMLGMLCLIAYSFAQLSHRKRGSKLQQRMVWLIALLIASPVTLVSVFSVLFLDLGLERWFSTEVKTALEESHQIAESYLEEHRKSLNRDMLGSARDFNQSFSFNEIQTEDINNFLDFIVSTRSINQAIIFEIAPSGTSKILARAGFTAILEIDPIKKEDIQKAINGELVLILGKDTDQARGLIRLRSASNLYLYAGRYVSAQVVQQTSAVRGAVQNFALLENQIDALKIGFISVFALFSILCILISVFLSITFARSIAQPIGNLTQAAKLIGKGKLDTRVRTENLSQDETAELSAEFNSMAAGLQQSQSALLAANADIASRQDYTDNILRSVSTGIIGMNKDGALVSINDRAMQILDHEMGDQIDLCALLPEISQVINDPHRIPQNGFWQKNTQIHTFAGQTKTVLLRMVRLEGEGTAQSLLSIDDITDLESAQRLAAWSEVAKRIAHEIRNPLTPIRLATERLRRKYPKLLEKLAEEGANVTEQDSQALIQSTSTILRQVDNITLMVKEFSDFARMPKAHFAIEDLSEICREAVFIEQNRDHQLSVTADIPNVAINWSCDRRQMVQVLVNLLKNAAESIYESGKPQTDSFINLQLQEFDQHITVTISDNGLGWPLNNREKLFDPYNTQRESGTGLGLAIVQRIVHEHNGRCALLDHASGGAIVELTFQTTVPSN